MEDQPNVDNDHVHTEVVVFTYRFVLLVKEIFRCFPIAAINENIVVYGVCVCVCKFTINIYLLHTTRNV